MQKIKFKKVLSNIIDESIASASRIFSFNYGLLFLTKTFDENPDLTRDQKEGCIRAFTDNYCLVYNKMIEETGLPIKPIDNQEEFYSKFKEGLEYVQTHGATPDGCNILSRMKFRKKIRFKNRIENQNLLNIKILLFC